MSGKTKLFLIALILTVTAGCATPPTDPAALAAYRETNDPLEPLNRKIFAFNMAADKYALRPAIKGYRAITTSGFRQKVRTFLANLKTPLTVVNDVLQLNFKNAGLDASRFVINSTLGFFGVFDVADRMGIPPNYQGLGTTLAVWGVPSGPYLVLPLLGPSNVRDAAGMAADIALDPMTYVPAHNDNDDLKRTIWMADAVEVVAAYDNALDLMDETRRTSLDFYATMRSMSRQYRKQTIEKAKGTAASGNDTPSYEFSLEDDFDE